MSKDPFSLTSSTEGLCFDKNEFSKVISANNFIHTIRYISPNMYSIFQKSFSVDSFLHNHRHCGTLEEIRDDLGLYLKALRSEMIELINEDYADFVNLSANLIGLDKSIQDILTPLQRLRNELATVKNDLQLSMDQVDTCLKDKTQMRRLYRSLQCITRLNATVQNLQQLLSASDSLPDPIHMERVVVLLCHLKNYLSKCEKLLKPDQLQSMKVLEMQSMDSLKSFFLSAIHSSHKRHLEVALRLYSMLNCTATAEAVHRTDVLKPLFTKIISEQSLQNSPKGLAGIYEQVIRYLDTDMRDLLLLSQQVDGQQFDFLLHSFWPEIEHRLEVNMSSIFAPGNPNFFYQKYQCTVDFLAQLETYVQNGGEALRSQKQYKSFLARWNLPVYFQIRFQEIGGAVETELSKSFTVAQLRRSEGVVKLLPIAVAIKNINRCWSEGVYLDPLLPRFLKLTLQIYGRLNSWVNALIKDETLALDGMTRTEFMMIIYGDLQQVKQSVPTLIEQVKGLLKCAANVSIDRCFSDAIDLMRASESLAMNEVIRELFGRSQAGIRQVRDIPRLYRKTNREFPTKPCPYVDEMIGPVDEFKKRFAGNMPSQQLSETLATVLSQINAQYFCAVDEVLTSVQKTEESLRRLKTLREKSTPQATANVAGGVTDDDKIRAQFYVDVGNWSKRIKELVLNSEAIDRLPALLNLVNQFSR